MAPRATTKKPKALIFEASNAEAVCTIVVVGVGCCAVEVQVTSISATYRATPIVAVSALIVEQTIDAITVTSRRIKHKLIHSYIELIAPLLLCSSAMLRLKCTLLQ